MVSIGKKILSAFIETTEQAPASPAAAVTPKIEVVEAPASAPASSPVSDQRFADYFDKLFSDANIPGPDYYEFSKMVAAMQVIPDERSRYYAAFAGLQVQGLDKQKLMSTAAEYLRVLTADASQFETTVQAALQEKVHSRTTEADEKAAVYRRCHRRSRSSRKRSPRCSGRSGRTGTN
ncbi:hypothetical protein ACQ86N_47135 [Puia sp. P3]|uniref:hypothetical protein n=1 Tax=Puia sp. P3 TaxID=3423952 RepID=UPI003D67E823